MRKCEGEREREKVRSLQGDSSGWDTACTGRTRLAFENAYIYINTYKLHVHIYGLEWAWNLSNSPQQCAKANSDIYFLLWVRMRSRENKQNSFKAFVVSFFSIKSMFRSRLPIFVNFAFTSRNRLYIHARESERERFTSIAERELNLQNG